MECPNCKCSCHFLIFNKCKHCISYVFPLCKYIGSFESTPKMVKSSIIVRNPGAFLVKSCVLRVRIGNTDWVDVPPYMKPCVVLNCKNNVVASTKENLQMKKCCDVHRYLKNVFVSIYGVNE